jgi:hypothetical protein
MIFHSRSKRKRALALQEQMAATPIIEAEISIALFLREENIWHAAGARSPEEEDTKRIRYRRIRYVAQKTR